MTSFNSDRWAKLSGISHDSQLDRSQTGQGLITEGSEIQSLMEQVSSHLLTERAGFVRRRWLERNMSDDFNRMLSSDEWPDGDPIGQRDYDRFVPLSVAHAIAAITQEQDKLDQEDVARMLNIQRMVDQGDSDADDLTPEESQQLIDAMSADVDGLNRVSGMTMSFSDDENIRTRIDDVEVEETDWDQEEIRDLTSRGGDHSEDEYHYKISDDKTEWYTKKRTDASWISLMGDQEWKKQARRTLDSAFPPVEGGGGAGRTQAAVDADSYQEGSRTSQSGDQGGDQGGDEGGEEGGPGEGGSDGQYDVGTYEWQESPGGQTWKMTVTRNSVAGSPNIVRYQNPRGERAFGSNTAGPQDTLLAAAPWQRIEQVASRQEESRVRRLMGDLLRETMAARGQGRLY